MTDLKCSDVLTRETFFWGGGNTREYERGKKRYSDAFGKFYKVSHQTATRRGCLR